ncbi:hypothetical protein BUALT_Bualt13G0007300 [Buddleja alternifolia]|uniref:Thyroid transcription factor 1-associated protein 26 n=1 Tax=Buddleja alternifolia TaxID=168488 RepID=A0AAV6WS75_9LAMI|nr:hypothetical protein BUALT_Bualt13G0007300 [Buddleja alternifolia]
MTKGRGISERSEKTGRKIDGGHDLIKDKMKMKKNMQRLGGRGGLSLESFAKAKSRDDNYNPALIKKQREFYKNAKYVSKYKKSLRQQEQQNVPFRAGRPSEGENDTKEGDFVNQHNKKSKKSARSLKELYEKKRDEEDRARSEREAIIQAKNAERQQSEARRKSLKEKMYKKTKSGQPVMKYRIEHLLETIQGSTS